MTTPEPEANEADLLEQRHEVGDADVPAVVDVPPDLDREADPADQQEQSLPVPAEEDDRRDG